MNMAQYSEITFHDQEGPRDHQYVLVRATGSRSPQTAILRSRRISAPRVPYRRVDLHGAKTSSHQTSQSVDETGLPRRFGKVRQVGKDDIQPS